MLKLILLEVCALLVIYLCVFAGGGSISDKANEVASHGRYGDTTLVHMTPNEVGGLASLGELTINPDTGLPEAFNLGSVFPLIANIGLAAVTGGMSVSYADGCNGWC